MSFRLIGTNLIVGYQSKPKFRIPTLNKRHPEHRHHPKVCHRTSLFGQEGFVVHWLPVPKLIGVMNWLNKGISGWRSLPLSYSSDQLRNHPRQNEQDQGIDEHLEIPHPLSPFEGVTVELPFTAESSPSPRRKTPLMPCSGITW